MSYIDWCQRWAHFNPHNTLALFSSFLKVSTFRQRAGLACCRVQAGDGLRVQLSAPPWGTSLNTRERTAVIKAQRERNDVQDVGGVVG